MATLKEIGYDLLQHLRASNKDDDDIDIRSVYYWIKNQRALWIKNELAKHVPTSNKLIQDLGSLAVSTDGTQKKTSATIPVPIHYRGMPKLVRVGSATITSDDYLILPYQSAKYHGNGRFNSALTVAYYYNGYVYIKGGTTSITTINVRGVFEDPMDVTGMTSDSEYPVDEHLIDYLKGEIIKLDLSVFARTAEDKTNDEENTLN